MREGKKEGGEEGRRAGEREEGRRERRREGRKEERKGKGRREKDREGKKDRMKKKNQKLRMLTNFKGLICLLHIISIHIAHSFYIHLQFYSEIISNSIDIQSDSHP